MRRQHKPNPATLDRFRAAAQYVVTHPGCREEQIAASVGQGLDTWSAAKRRHRELWAEYLEEARTAALQQANDEAMLVLRRNAMLRPTEGLGEKDCAVISNAAAGEIVRANTAAKGLIVKVEQTVPLDKVRELGAQFVEVTLPFVPEEQRDEWLRAIEAAQV